MNLITVLVILVAAGVLVVVSELARRSVARLCKLHVEGGLRFAPLTGPGRPGATLAALAAGPVTTYLGVGLLAFILFAQRGVPGSEQYVITELVSGFDSTGKLAPGDRLVAFDQDPVVPGVGLSVAQRVNQRGGAPVTLTILRDGASQDVTLQPIKQATESPEVTIWRLGIKFDRQRVTAGQTGAAARSALRYPLDQLAAIAGGLRTELLGSDELELGGPIRIIEELQATEESSWLALGLALLVSSYVLLATLVFDGIRALLLAIATLRRRPAS